jgi:guanylate kinase
LEIDVQGGLRVAGALGQACVTIFVDVTDDQELIRRITKRNQEQEAEIRSRMETAAWERKQKEHYRYVVINDRLRDAVERTQEIIKEAREEYASAIN